MTLRLLELLLPGELTREPVEGLTTIAGVRWFTTNPLLMGCLVPVLVLALASGLAMLRVVSLPALGPSELIIVMAIWGVWLFIVWAVWIGRHCSCARAPRQRR